ncbi:hypothetical protein O7622_17910 [Micromonospora sp. WMMD1076]|uniref:hypothetical protein n=1 Tax=Micromonospora sp. WMMD1076 TaxID=3016103 RepID=UPI00249CCA48|nr:hypothetical protein [Micromonospora sp. WMMD1076]WFF04937.1 hypothetical protein O7622_17910 [Micromonospora sp. WMMD1076]
MSKPATAALVERLREASVVDCPFADEALAEGYATIARPFVRLAALLDGGRL